MHNVLRLSKEAGFDSGTGSTADGLLNAFHRFESQLQLDLTPPTERTTIAEFMAELQIRRDAWFDQHKTFVNGL